MMDKVGIYEPTIQGRRLLYVCISQDLEFREQGLNESP
jgi:hypothetical protein